MEYITGFISKNTSYTVLERGERIFKAKRCREEKSDFERGEFRFSVASDSGPHKYQVSIYGVNSRNIQYSCTCPYSEQGLCKHLVACLMNIRQKMILKEVVDSQKEYSPSEVVIPISHGIEVALQKIKISKQKKERAHELIKNNYIVKLKEERATAVFQVSDRKNVYELHFERLNKQHLKTSCTCGEMDSELCSHKYAVFFKLAKIDSNAFYFDMFLDHDKEKNKLLAMYGFSLDDDLRGKFDFKLAKGKLSLVVLDPAIRKLSSHSLAAEGLRLHMPDINSILGLETAIFKENDHRLAFVFDFDPYSEALEEKIVPIVVKYDAAKSRFGKVIGEYYECDASQLPAATKEDFELLRLVEELTDYDKLIEHLRNVGVSLADVSEFDRASMRYYFNKFLPIHHRLKNYPVFIKDSHKLVITAMQLVTLSDQRLNMKFTVTEEGPLLVLNCFFFIEGEDDELMSFTHDRHEDEHGGGEQEDVVAEDWEEEYDEFDNYYEDNDGTGYDFEDGNDFFEDFYFKKGNVLHFHGVHEHALNLAFFRNNPEIKVHESDWDAFLRETVLPLSKLYPVEMKTQKKKVVKAQATGPVHKVYLKEHDKFLLIQPAVTYEQKEVELFDKELIVVTEDSKVTHYERNEEYEKQLRTYFISLHPTFPRQTERGIFYVRLEELMKDEWFMEFFGKLKDEKWEILGYDSLSSIKKYNYHKPYVSVNASSGTDWFDLTIHVKYGEQKVKLKDIQKSFLRGEKYVKLGDGTLGVIPEEWMRKLEAAMKHGEIKGDHLKVSKLHFSMLDSLFTDLNHFGILQELRDKKKKLLEFTEISEVAPPVPAGAQLRDYQVAAFHWFNFLDEYNWGGCLADDMGLGKTLQMLTFLKHQTVKNFSVANLVVVPTTLIFNWIKEAEKFYPELKCLVLHGTQRNKDMAEFSNYDLVFTSYTTLIRDIEYIKEYTFNYVVLDESQAIKNPASQRYKAVRLLKSRNRIALTGTPIENNTFDLYAQMSFINPGLLGSMEFFKEEYSTPIDKKADALKAEELRRLIKPFMLRRTKEQVAKELPDKTEMTMFCEMDEPQRKVYNAFRDHFRNVVLNKVSEEGLGKSSIVILDALMKLRQICNSPALLNTEEDYGSDSVKIRELVRHIIEKTGNHKILIFSQFVKMLKLIEKEIKKHGIGFEYLDGKTKDRQERVSKFQNDDTCRVFLISLKAGGVGINLTEADYVYLVDPWWNPAIESQAIDRAHRIGQTRKVFAYRLICKDTIEEKVLKLQERKRAVANELIQTEASFIKQLDKSDIEELFS